MVDALEGPLGPPVGHDAAPQPPAQGAGHPQRAGALGRTATTSSSASTRSAAGAWAGPLTLGAVVIPKDKRLTKVRDSKMLTARRA